MMPQTRISQDVWDLGQEVAAARGLSNPRTAIEAIVRVYAQAYKQGAVIQVEAISAPIAPPASDSGTNAQEALSNLLAQF